MSHQDKEGSAVLIPLHLIISCVYVPSSIVINHRLLVLTDSYFSTILMTCNCLLLIASSCSMALIGLILTAWSVLSPSSSDLEQVCEAIFSNTQFQLIHERTHVTDSPHKISSLSDNSNHQASTDHFVISLVFQTYCITTSHSKTYSSSHAYNFS